MTLLQRLILLRTSTLIVMLVGSICVGLSLYAVRDQRAVESARAQAMTVFLAERTRPYLVHEERAGLQGLLEQMVHSHGGVLYVAVERGDRLWVEVPAGLLPRGALHRSPAVAGPPTVREVVLADGVEAYDTSFIVTGTDADVHVGSLRPRLASATVTRITIVGISGFIAILLGVALAWRIALLTTREVHRQERALRASETRYRQLFDQAPESIMLLDLADPAAPTILDANAATFRMHGYSKAELIGRPVSFLDAPADQARVAERSRQFAAGKVVTFEVEHVRKDGSVFPVEVSAQLIDLDGRPVLQAIDRDISERRRAAEQHARLEEQLRQAQKLQAIGQLAGGVAHDLNNILGGIMGAASLLEAALPADDPHREHVRHVLDACGRGRDLTRNLLGFARQGARVKEPLDLNDLVDATLGILRRTVPRKVTLTVDPGADLRPVVGDRSQLTQALLNVCLNAVDAMPGGGTLAVATRSRAVAASEDDDLPAGTYVAVTMRDTGGGMDATTLARAFEPFFTTKPVGEGTGLGLSMVYGAVRSHGGTVRLTSTPGAGTEVVILLPAATGTAPAKRPPAAPVPTVRPGAGTVLLVEDEKLVRWAGENMLRKLGYEVLTAQDGREALEVFRAERERITLVILDLIMPSMDGEETFGRLRALDPTVKVLIATGYSQDEKLEALLTGGALGIIEKPFDLAQLGQRLAEVLEPGDA